MRDWRDEDERAVDTFARRVLATMARLFGKAEPVKAELVKPLPVTPRPARTPAPIGPITEAQADKILRGVFGDRLQRCPGCNGVGRTTETFQVWGRYDAERYDVTCPVCNSKGLISVYAEAA